MNGKTLMIARGALIAAMYAAVTLIFLPVSYGPVQFRISEALTLLPCLWPEAIPGLFAGCLIANLIGGMGPWDVILGSAATLSAGVLTYLAPNRILAASAPVAVNALIVGWYLSFLTNMPVYLSVLYVACGEAVACYALGLPLIRFLEHIESIKTVKNK
ncbi:MAG: QueT transporter family protein [Synergistaceae bacterium]|jgi:uncharacterized membrane protein|nr:QueT transporter family protein [Synergistaceae bacterium]